MRAGRQSVMKRNCEEGATFRKERCCGVLNLISAGELIARQLQSVEISEDGYGDRFCLEELICQFGQLISRDTLDALDQFVQAEEMIKVHFLPGEVGHSRGG